MGCKQRYFPMHKFALAIAAVLIAISPAGAKDAKPVIPAQKTLAEKVGTQPDAKKALRLHTIKGCDPKVAKCTEAKGR